MCRFVIVQRGYGCQADKVLHVIAQVELGETVLHYWHKCVRLIRRFAQSAKCKVQRAGIEPEYLASSKAPWTAALARRFSCAALTKPAGDRVRPWAQMRGKDRSAFYNCDLAANSLIHPSCKLARCEVRQGGHTKLQWTWGLDDELGAFQAEKRGRLRVRYHLRSKSACPPSIPTGRSGDFCSWPLSGTTRPVRPNADLPGL